MQCIILALFTSYAIASSEIGPVSLSKPRYAKQEHINEIKSKLQSGPSQYLRDSSTLNKDNICGKPIASKPNQDGRGTDRIVGGTETGVSEFPWQVQLVMKDEDGEFSECGGSLINELWILTAAHCVDKSSVIYIVLGAHRGVQDGYIDSNAIFYNVSEYVIHPEWNPTSYTADVALIKLPHSIQFTERIRPICLATDEDSDHVYDYVVVTGWGLISDDSDSSPVLMKAATTVIPNDKCSRIYGGTWVNYDHICTDVTHGQGVCGGDSGGPLSYVNPDGTYTQIGIVSFGAPSGCAATHPDVHSRVRSYYYWISSESKIPEHPTSSATKIYTSNLNLNYLFCCLSFLMSRIFITF